MAVTIKGNNNGIVVEDGNLSIDELNFEFGKGIKSAKGMKVSGDIQDVPYEEVGENGGPKRKPGRTQTRFFKSEVVEEEQRKRVYDFFVKHNLYDSLWTSAAEDIITQYVVCIVNKWQREGIIDKGIADTGFSYKALVRFFVEVCGVPTQVGVEAIANTIGERKSRRCDTKVEEMVGADF